MNEKKQCRVKIRNRYGEVENVYVSSGAWRQVVVDSEERVHNRRRVCAGCRQATDWSFGKCNSTLECMRCGKAPCEGFIVVVSEGENS